VRAAARSCASLVERSGLGLDRDERARKAASRSSVVRVGQEWWCDLVRKVMCQADRAIGTRRGKQVLTQTPTATPTPHTPHEPDLGCAVPIWQSGAATTASSCTASAPGADSPACALSAPCCCAAAATNASSDSACCGAVAPIDANAPQVVDSSDSSCVSATSAELAADPCAAASACQDALL